MPSRLPIDEAVTSSEEQVTVQEGPDTALQKAKQPMHKEADDTSSPSADEVQLARRVITQLPREFTFKRQQSELRERLLPVPDATTRMRSGSRSEEQIDATSLAPAPDASGSPLDAKDTNHIWAMAPVEPALVSSAENSPPPPTADSASGCDIDREGRHGENVDQVQLRLEYSSKWVLNLSMHFRDQTNREKFFITYAQSPSFWRRMTISLDYRNAPAGSLEADLSTLPYQRDKSFRIFEALRDSLAEVKFYDTVTNLKLVTDPKDLQLHVHVREDTNEIIDYPHPSSFEHIECKLYTEDQLSFMSHLSGFVYKVAVNGCTLVKKEIPGVDTVDEFIYEVNALDALRHCPSVMPLAGLVTNNKGDQIKGLLVEYAEKDALVDALYDWAVADLPWSLRLKWARQIITGLSAIHEAGFVQGDFTLSNIVIDANDDAHIIDINRRGCPMGWEPPELLVYISNGQRVSMYIGVKTDLYQLGMVLWALAGLNDEPERCERPLPELGSTVPAFFRDIVKLCLQRKPKDRPSAKLLMSMFEDGYESWRATSQADSVQQISQTNQMGQQDMTMDWPIRPNTMQMDPYLDEPSRGRTLSRRSPWQQATTGASEGPSLDTIDDSKFEASPASYERHNTQSTDFTAPHDYHLPTHKDSGFDEEPSTPALENLRLDDAIPDTIQEQPSAEHEHGSL